MTFLDDPLPRDPTEAVLLERQRVLASRLINGLLEFFPGLALILNAKRQILAVNSKALTHLRLDAAEGLVGQRLGEAIHCVHADTQPGGCGNSPHCPYCGAFQTIHHALVTSEITEGEALLTMRATGQAQRLIAHDLGITAQVVQDDSLGVIFVSLVDRGSEHRRRVLEKVFFHDIMNTVSGIRGLTEILAQAPGPRPTEEREILTVLGQATDQLVEEIRGQQILLRAEEGNLILNLEVASSRAILEGVRSFYAKTLLAKGRGLEVVAGSDCSFQTDPGLLRRILGNMVKNALEASGPAEVTSLAAEPTPAGVIFRVHNAAVMAPEVQARLFTRSFSTKAPQGRGLGTYSMKLLGEGYLGGRVSFESTVDTGTTFYLELGAGRN